MDLFFLLIVVIFVLGPIIEKALKGGAGQPPRQRRPLPGQRVPQGRVPQRYPRIPTPESADESGPAGENAADILPADLWEMLTGQRPSNTEPMRTGPAPPPQEPAPEEELEAVVLAPSIPAPRDARAEADLRISRRDRELVEARTLHREPPQIVSLETPVQPARIRHEAFHKKLEARGTTTAKVEKPAGPRLRMDKLPRSELQRAVLLQEILGEPKGLE